MREKRSKLYIVGIQNKHQHREGSMCKSFNWSGKIAGALLLLALCVLTPLTYAGTGMSITPQFPPVIVVGQTDVPVIMYIQNASTPDVGTVRIDPTVAHDKILLHSDCYDDFCLSSQNPATPVFSYSATGTGGGAFAGATFTITYSAITGQASFQPSTTLLLPLGVTGTVSFTVNCINTPDGDAYTDAANPGKQVIQEGIVQATQVSAPNQSASGTGNDNVTIPTPCIQITKTVECNPATTTSCPAP